MNFDTNFSGPEIHRFLRSVPGVLTEEREKAGQLRFLSKQKRTPANSVFSPKFHSLVVWPVWKQVRPEPARPWDCSRDVRRYYAWICSTHSCGSMTYLCFSVSRLHHKNLALDEKSAIYRLCTNRVWLASQTAQNTTSNHTQAYRSAYLWWRLWQCRCGMDQNLCKWYTQWWHSNHQLHRRAFLQKERQV